MKINDKKILVTGSNGFLGKNLVNTLATMNEYYIYTFDKNNSYDDLKLYCSKVDIIIHLAGVNRPKKTDEFELVNYGLTKKIIDICISIGRKVPILFSSSIQIERDNLYGKSKLHAEQVLENYSKTYSVPITIIRYPNLFGKFCKPNYNSFISTFCYNIINGQKVEITDGDKLIPLLYIDDAVKLILDNLNNAYEEAKVITIDYVTKVSVNEVYSILLGFNEFRSKNVINIKNDFEKKLYSTFLSYIEPTNHNHLLEMHKDNRGFFTEFIKNSNFGQVSMITSKPGVTRGNHWHNTKIERFFVVYGKAKISMRRVGQNEIIDYIVDDLTHQYIEIPPGFTHKITNIGSSDLVTLIWANEIYDNTNPDTFFETVDI